jgi:hypothetical protein
VMFGFTIVSPRVNLLDKKPGYSQGGKGASASATPKPAEPISLNPAD